MPYSAWTIAVIVLTVADVVGSSNGFWVLFVIVLPFQEVGVNAGNARMRRNGP